VRTNLPSFARSADVKLQEIQKIHTASVSMILKAASGLTEASNQPDESSLVKDTMSSLKEAMNLAGKTSQLLNQFRRDQIKPSLPRDFKKLAMDNDESLEFLFGSSVCDRRETLKKENKLTSLLEKEKGYKRKAKVQPTSSQKEVQELNKQVRNDTVLKDYLKRRVESFEGGSSLRHHYKEWENITSDKEILQTVSGLRKSCEIYLNTRVEISHRMLSLKTSLPKKLRNCSKRRLSS